MGKKNNKRLLASGKKASWNFKHCAYTYFYNKILVLWLIMVYPVVHQLNKKETSWCSILLYQLVYFIMCMYHFINITLSDLNLFLKYFHCWYQHIWYHTKFTIYHYKQWWPYGQAAKPSSQKMQCWQFIETVQIQNVSRNVQKGLQQLHS